MTLNERGLLLTSVYSSIVNFIQNDINGDDDDDDYDNQGKLEVLIIYFIKMIMFTDIADNFSQMMIYKECKIYK